MCQSCKWLNSVHDLLVTSPNVIHGCFDSSKHFPNEGNNNNVSVLWVILVFDSYHDAIAGTHALINHMGLVTTTLPLLLSGANRKCRPLVPLKESTTHTGLVVSVFPWGVRTAVTGTYKHIYIQHHVDTSGSCPQNWDATSSYRMCIQCIHVLTWWRHASQSSISKLMQTEAIVCPLSIKQVMHELLALTALTVPVMYLACRSYTRTSTHVTLRSQGRPRHTWVIAMPVVGSTNARPPNWNWAPTVLLT